MLYVIIERFHNGHPRPVYERFDAHGRMAPDGVRYVDSWITSDLTTCYQVMETDDRSRLDQWMANWKDLVDFEVHEVMTSPEARLKAMGKGCRVRTGRCARQRFVNPTGKSFCFSQLICSCTFLAHPSNRSQAWP